FCNKSLHHSFVDLGMSPLANNYLKEENLTLPEPFYPLNVFVCDGCFLVQLAEYENPQNIFSDYAYFSSYSDTWTNHARHYVDMMMERYQFTPDSLVMELASNDGYLLQYFQGKGIPVLGIEPAKNVAQAALEKEIPTVVKFFGTELANELVKDGKHADLVIGNNVLAHVPNLNDVIKGLKIVMKPDGLLTMEFPHLLQLMKHNEFDTIYHEHFSYFSFIAVEKIFRHHGITLFDVEQIPTHGGSLRIFGRHDEDRSKQVTDRVTNLRNEEISEGLNRIETYTKFSQQVQQTKRKLLDFLIRSKQEGKKIAGYGAPAKGNTLLNYCGVRTDFIDFTVDRNPAKQYHFLPGTHIPIFHPDKIKEEKPDYLLILPWNIKNEIIDQNAFIRDWGGKFVTPIPEVEVIP
ncbi:methyltransferase domain-containing protein, partial [candidate division KSB1 bacterium]|nr:methyltransferase domain-containing protein [candidate division KSB1 bacterium]